MIVVLLFMNLQNGNNSIINHNELFEISNSKSKSVVEGLRKVLEQIIV